jgi:parvulin-like peptidyl-prolyl isomerase
VKSQVNEEKIIAKIGSEVITESEFIERYEFTPQLFAGVKGAEDALKKELLYSIIAEKLWALEAELMDLDNSELIKSTYKALEKMYVRDALYREEILNKVQLSENYLSEAFRRNSLILDLHYIFSNDESEIFKIYNQIKSGTDFYSIFLQRPESGLQEKPYIISYGQMDKVVEDRLYGLNPGEITEPLKAPNGWYIFRLLSIDQKIIENAHESEEQKKYVLKVAEATITDSLYKSFYTNFFKNVNAETNRDLLFRLSDPVIQALKFRSLKENISVGDRIYLNSDDLYTIEAALGQKTLNSVFIKVNNQTATVDDFLQELSIEKFYVDSLDNDHIRGRLNFYVKRFIEHELLASEGYKRGLQNLPEVRRYLNIWKSYFLSEALRNKIIDSIEVTDDETYEYFLERDSDTSLTTEVKIIEVLTDNLDIIRTVLDKLKDGEDFRELSVKYTIREEAKKNNGELGFFNNNEYGEIGSKAALMNVGEMYGPIKVQEGYSLFKLIEKKETKNFIIQNFEQRKDLLKTELKSKKYNDAIIKKTVQLANKYNIQINEEIMNSIKVLNTTTVVFRNFGFGGKLLAVPLTPPNYLWFKFWQEQENLAP